MTEEQSRKENRVNASAILFSLLIVSHLLGVLGAQVYHGTAITDVYELGQSEIPTIERLQQMLTDTNNPRYDPCGVDGCPGPKTIKAWKNWSFDQYAIACFEGE